MKIYYCYLLESMVQDLPRGACRTYIGSTPDPVRRIKQHNGIITSGARRTARSRPWRLRALVGGFHSQVAALQFEWAWSHFRKSRKTKIGARTAQDGIKTIKESFPSGNVDDTDTNSFEIAESLQNIVCSVASQIVRVNAGKSDKSDPVSKRIAHLMTMLAQPAWRRLPLTIWLLDDCGSMDSQVWPVRIPCSQLNVSRTNLYYSDTNDTAIEDTARQICSVIENWFDNQEQWPAGQDRKYEYRENDNIVDADRVSGNFSATAEAVETKTNNNDDEIPAGKCFPQDTNIPIESYDLTNLTLISTSINNSAARQEQLKDSTSNSESPARILINANRCVICKNGITAQRYNKPVTHTSTSLVYEFQCRNCSSWFHLQCLARHSLECDPDEKTQILPIQSVCSKCGAIEQWINILQ